MTAMIVQPCMAGTKFMSHCPCTGKSKEGCMQQCVTRVETSIRAPLVFCASEATLAFPALNHSRSTPTRCWVVFARGLPSLAMCVLAEGSKTQHCSFTLLTYTRKPETDVMAEGSKTQSLTRTRGAADPHWKRQAHLGCAQAAAASARHEETAHAAHARDRSSSW